MSKTIQAKSLNIDFDSHEVEIGTSFGDRIDINYDEIDKETDELLVFHNDSGVYMEGVQKISMEYTFDDVIYYKIVLDSRKADFKFFGKDEEVPKKYKE